MTGPTKLQGAYDGKPVNAHPKFYPHPRLVKFECAPTVQGLVAIGYSTLSDLTYTNLPVIPQRRL